MQKGRRWKVAVVAGKKLRWRTLVETACVVKLSSGRDLEGEADFLAVAVSITLACLPVDCFTQPRTALEAQLLTLTARIF